MAENEATLKKCAGLVSCLGVAVLGFSLPLPAFALFCLKAGGLAGVVLFGLYLMPKAQR